MFKPMVRVKSTGDIGELGERNRSLGLWEVKLRPGLSVYLEEDKIELTQESRRQYEAARKAADAVFEVLGQWASEFLEHMNRWTWETLRPMVLELEDAGILESTYQDDLGEPEADVFI